MQPTYERLSRRFLRYDLVINTKKRYGCCYGICLKMWAELSVVRSEAEVVMKLSLPCSTTVCKEQK